MRIISAPYDTKQRSACIFSFQVFNYFNISYRYILCIINLVSLFSPGTQVMEFCSHRTRSECTLEGNENCKKLHFKKIIEPHTEESLGDCSYLNTCFHMDTCKLVFQFSYIFNYRAKTLQSNYLPLLLYCRYVHYEVDKLYSDEFKNSRIQNCDLNSKKKIMGQENTILHPPQWIQCDLRYFDTSILGNSHCSTLCMLAISLL